MRSKDNELCIFNAVIVIGGMEYKGDVKEVRNEKFGYYNEDGLLSVLDENSNFHGVKI